MVRLSCVFVTGLLLITSSDLQFSAHAEPRTEQEIGSADAWHSDLEYFVNVVLENNPLPFESQQHLDILNEVKSLRKDLDDLTPNQRFVRFGQILAMIGDGHTQINAFKSPEGIYSNYPDFHTIPVRMELFDDGLFVVGTFHHIAWENPGFLKGQILAIDNVPVEAAISKVKTLTPSNAPNLARGIIPQLLMITDLLHGLNLISDPTEITLTVKSQDGNVRDVKISASKDFRWMTEFSSDSGPVGRDYEWAKATHADDLPYYRFQPFAATRKQVDDNHVHLVMNSIMDIPGKMLNEAISDSIHQMRQMEAPNLILDLRNSLGGNGCLLPQIMEVMADNSDLFNDNRFYVLISRKTFSASINLVTLLETYTDAILVGEATGEAPNFRGDRSRYMLPANQVTFSISSVMHMNTTPDDVRKEISPDYEVPYLSEDYFSGNDRVLDKALELMAHGKIKRAAERPLKRPLNLEELYLSWTYAGIRNTRSCDYYYPENKPNKDSDN